MPAPLETHRGLREVLDSEQILQLVQDVRAHYQALADAQRRNELLAINLAERLCSGLEALLVQATTLPAEAHADIVGAARYFVSTQDAIPDHRACTGLDDDVLVFNHVVRRLGRPELEIRE